MDTPMQLLLAENRKKREGEGRGGRQFIKHRLEVSRAPRGEKEGTKIVVHVSTEYHQKKGENGKKRGISYLGLKKKDSGHLWANRWEEYGRKGREGDR